jgi:hypothetical protein
MKPVVVTTSWDDGRKRDMKLARLLGNPRRIKVIGQALPTGKTNRGSA